MHAGPIQGSYGLRWGKEATGGDRDQEVPEELHQRSGPGETGYLEGPKDDGEVPGFRYEDVQTRVQEAGGTGGGVDEGWLSGVCSGSRGEAGSGGEWARGVPGEGRDSVDCYGRKQG